MVIQIIFDLNENRRSYFKLKQYHENKMTAIVRMLEVSECFGQLPTTDARTNPSESGTPTMTDTETTMSVFFENLPLTTMTLLRQSIPINCPAFEGLG